MNRPLTLAATAAAIAVLASGCAVNRATATLVDDKVDLASIRTVHVVKLPKDERGIDQLVADKFRRRGLTATTGSTRPERLDGVVTYADRWMWDMTMYMLELTITIRDPKSDYPLAVGNSYHTSLTRKSPAEMVEEVVDNIYAKGGAR